MSARMRTMLNWIVSAVTGSLCAIIIHYMLYRISIPLKPFIYVVF